MNLHYKSKKSILVVILIFIFFLIVVLFLIKPITSPSGVGDIPIPDEVEIETAPPEDNESLDKVVQTIFVDLKGAVNKTGVYEMAPGLRVQDVITEAGGFSKAADVNKINLAALLEDEMVIYVPLIGEDIELDELQVNQTEEKKGSTKKVNLNTATSEELQTLTGIGPSKATTIISYREEHGAFTSVEGLLEVSGIGEKTLEKIIENITVK